jgi:N-acetylmuramoyl-L-alanine amidase
MITNFYPSPNVNDRVNGQKPSLVILHYTGTVTAIEAHEIYMMPQKVSPHYMVDRDGSISQYVHEDKRAWHAGKSYWRGDTDINSSSIGIEIVNSGHEYDMEPFPDVQMNAVVELVRGIQSRWNIPHKNILGHSDIAVGRKIDPGEHFPWEFLHANNIGILPDPNHTDMIDHVHQALITIGYDPDVDLYAVIGEFRRHYLRHTDLNAGVDDELRRALSSILQQIS